MTSPETEMPPQIYNDARVISSCSRWPASLLGGQVFAGLVNPWDIQATHKQELLIAYVMGLARLLVEKGVFAREEFAGAVEGWLTGRKSWAQDLANETIDAWNLDNPERAQPPFNVDDLNYRNAEPPAQLPFWPWGHDFVQEPLEEPPPAP